MVNFEKNLNFIKIKYPHLLKVLTGMAAGDGINLETGRSRTGLPVVRLTKDERKIYLNSAYDPELEAERWVERRSGNEKSALILCGGGFLYHLKAILQQGRYRKVVCYEPSAAILKACLQEVDLSGIKGDFLMLTGANYQECANLVTDYLANLMLDSDWAALPPYQEIFQDQIGAFQNALRESVRISRANLATANLFGEKWVSNAVKNLATITGSPGVKHFFNQFNGVPAVVVSAGPSLEKNIHLLKDIREKAVIICAGTGIRAMRKYGVAPHFLVAFDGTDYNKTIYSNLDLEDICLIYNYRFNHCALSYFGGKKVYMKLDMETFSDFLSLKSGGYEFGTVRSGFSVAHPSLDLAIKLGCSPVILIGQDLAYTGDKRYAESQYQMFIDRNKLPANCFLTKDIYGQDTVTDRQLDSFRMLFEMMVAEYYQGKKILNATEGGQPIKGVPNYKLADLIQEFCRQERGINQRIEGLYDSGLKVLQRQLSRKTGLVRQIRTMAQQGIIKMETLFDRLQQIKHRNFTGEPLPSGLDSALNEAAAEYEGFVAAKEWRLFLKDLRDWKIIPNQLGIANLGKVESREGFSAKLQCWSNIISETKGYLEYVIEQLTDAPEKQEGGAEQGLPSIVQIAGAKTPGQIGEEIRNGGALSEIQTQLETLLNQGNRKDLNEFRYWYGLVLFKQNELPKAVLILEQAQRHDQSDAKISFLLYRCYRRLQNFSKIQACLENCLRLGFKPDFCRRMLVKNAYRSKSYVSANNYLSDLETAAGANCFYQCIRIDCLRQLQLSAEATAGFQDLAANSRIRKELRERLEGALAESQISDYERNYRSNKEFFEKRKIRPGDFAAVRLKLCNYFDQEYIYDAGSKRFLLAVNEPCATNLEISADDVLLICDTNDPGIYHQLKRLFQESQHEKRQLLALLPVFIIEHQLANWQLMMQKFDFNELEELPNIHFLIGVEDEDLERVFLDDAAPLPNVLYGTGLDQIKQLLAKIEVTKENSYQDRLTELQGYYRKAKPESPVRLLIVTSSKEELLLEYGKALQLYLEEQGFETGLDFESPPYFKFNKYAALSLLERFRPDLAVCLFGMAEELEAYRDLDLPFISWRISDHWLLANVTASRPKQKVLISGESRVNSSLSERGFLPEQIKSVSLPYLAASVGEAPCQAIEHQISIFKDLQDQGRILERLAAAVLAVLSAGTALSGAEIIIVCRSIYFNLLTGLLDQSSLAPGDQIYQTIVRDEFQKRGRTLEQEKLQLIAGLFRHELGDSMLTLVQVKWLINRDRNYQIKLYGAGWEKDLSLKGYQAAAIKLFDKERQRLVSQSKINLYPELMIKNNSYLQPDLVNGIAGGGFFLVNGSLAMTIGEKALEPFAGLLEIYRNREELMGKVEYYLQNEVERSKKAGRLREHVLQNFAIGQVAKVILEAYREIDAEKY